ncbi:hypothetical protein, partial [Caproicibacter sp.]|uniref:hypothetical protein n=1 Tax=Caproicibacter sp. TaxID=2814884 RepID=UPI003989BF46
KAADGTTQDYKVTVKVASGAEFQSYSLKEKDGSDYYTGTIDKENHIIQVKVPYGTDVTQLIAKFATVEDAPVTIGTTVQDSNHTENDFTGPIFYTVTAADGTKQKYKVTVTVTGETSFQSYSLTDENGNTYDGTIDDDNGTIAVTVAKDTNVKKLTAEFTTSAAVTVEVKGTEQVSGETVNDFTNPVTYTVTAKSGSTQNYKVTVTIHSDQKDDDDKESSHHHNHSSDSSPKPKKPETKTTVDSEKNTASVAAVASDVTQNGNVAEIQVLVPTITSDSSNGKTALDLSKDAAVTIELPKNDIIQQINAGKSANVSLTLPSEAKNDGSSNLAVSIPIAKEILEAAKEGTKDLTLKVQYADQQQASYTWAFKGEDLAKSGTPLSDVDMQTSILPAAKVSAVNRLTNGVQGLVVEFAQDGALPAPAAIGFSAQDQGLAANQSMDVYQLDSLSGQLIPTGKKVAVDAFGNTSLSVDNCEDYVLLPDSVRTITLDTRVYTMNVGDSYETGVTLLNAPAGSRLKAYSSTDGVIAATVLPNGDVKAIGLKPGLTYAMIDVYDSKNHFLTHASVRIIVKGETTKPYGNSWRQFGIF